jgi:hypothetical protein
MHLSRAVSGTAPLLKKHAPGLFASIRNNTPRGLRSLINERMTVDNLGVVGADIVHDLVGENRRKYPTVEFDALDVLKDPLPQVDAWLAQDLMIHFPGEAVRTALKQFRRSKIGYPLAITYPRSRQNTDIRFGQVRHLNLCAPPFGLPPPFDILREDDDPKTGRIIGSSILNDALIHPVMRDCG